ncbi:unnamed protein product [Brassica oleracea]|uniref:(rape) hypothetical protein n=1 Tax=Brassica napus TaxID=3708 RepID=A0A816UMV4_BRANA|nr:unnamed protein product [Brassica napus]
MKVKVFFNIQSQIQIVLNHYFLSGCKFSAEEEKRVIDLQSQFGNKWARIATYLPGRTDNDVKNFWSMLGFYGPNNCIRTVDEKSERRPKDPSNRNETLQSGKRSSAEISQKILELWVEHPLKATQSNLRFSITPQMHLSSSCFNPKPNKDKNRLELPLLLPLPRFFPILPYSSSTSDQVDDEALIRLPELGIKLENHQPFTFGTVLDDPFFYDILGPADSSEPLFGLPQPFFEPSPAPRRFRHVSKDDEESDVFLHDFPADMFDQVDDQTRSS